MRESARIYDVRMAQFVLKIEKLSHIIGARESRDLRSPSPIMAPGLVEDLFRVDTVHLKHVLKTTSFRTLKHKDMFKKLKRRPSLIGII